MAELVFKPMPRLTILLRSNGQLNLCQVCDAPLKLGEEQISHLLGDRMWRFKASAAYYELLEQRAEKVLKREINLEELGKLSRRLWDLYASVKWSSHKVILWMLTKCLCKFLS